MSSSINSIDRTLCVTRGIKNAKYIKRIAPHIVARLGRKGITSLIPAEMLLKLHTISNFSEITEDKELAGLLEQNKPPSPLSIIDPQERPLFNGTLFFVNLFLGTPNGTFSMRHDDIRTAINYSKEAVISISQYASQYASNTDDDKVFKTIRVSDRIFNFAPPILDGNTFSDDDLVTWTEQIADAQHLSDRKACIVFMIDVSGGGPINSDGDPADGTGGYHSSTINIFGNNYPYIFVNVRGQNLTIDDAKDQYAHTLSHEIAEMIVDPFAWEEAPEVCDGCAGNCKNSWNDFFDQNYEFIDGSNAVPPSFSYFYFINSIIDPKYMAVCEKNRRDICAYWLHDPTTPHSLREWLMLKGFDASEGISSIMSKYSVSTLRQLVGYP